MTAFAHSISEFWEVDDLAGCEPWGRRNAFMLFISVEGVVLSLSSEPGSQTMDVVACSGRVRLRRTARKPGCVFVGCPLLGESEASLLLSHPYILGPVEGMVAKIQLHSLRESGGGEKPRYGLTLKFYLRSGPTENAKVKYRGCWWWYWEVTYPKGHQERRGLCRERWWCSHQQTPYLLATAPRAPVIPAPRNKRMGITLLS